MIRVVLYLILVGLVAIGAAWLADRPGEVTILWLGHRIETQVIVLAGVIALVAALTVLLWSLLRLLLRSSYRIVPARPARPRLHVPGALSRGAGPRQGAARHLARPDRDRGGRHARGAALRGAGRAACGA